MHELVAGSDNLSALRCAEQASLTADGNMSLLNLTFLVHALY